MLSRLAFYVSQVANGNLTQLLSSGFVVSSPPSTGQVPEIIRGVLLRDGRQSGQMRLDFQRQNNSLLYEFRYGHETDADQQVIWQDVLITSSSRGNIIAPVVPYQRYQVQVRAMNTYGKSEWSEPVSHFVR